MKRRTFLKSLAGGLAGLALLPSGLVVPEDMAEPIKRYWPGWRAGEPSGLVRVNGVPLGGVSFLRPPITLAAGDSLQLTYAITMSDETVDLLTSRQAFAIDVAKHVDDSGYTLFANGQPVYQRVRHRTTVFRPGLFDAASGVFERAGVTR